MPLKNTFIIILVLSGFACCNKKSNRQLPLEDDQVNSLLLQQYVSAKQYDSIFALGSRWLNSKFERNKADTAMILADTLCTLLAPVKNIQKKLLLDIYSKRDIIEKDTGALHKFYDLFANSYSSTHFHDSYDPEYVDIAEYFILLAKKNLFLSPDLVEGFQQNLGIAYNVVGDLKKALYYGNIIYNKDLKRNSYDYLPFSTINLSTALNESGQTDSVIRITNFALQNKYNTDYNRSGLYLVMSEALLQQNKIPEASEYANLAEEIAIKIHDADDQANRLSDIYSAKSSILMAKQQFTEAVTFSYKAFRYGLIHEQKYHTRSIGKNLLQLGSTFKSIGQADSAIWYFHQALYTVAQVDSADINSLPAEKYIYAENTMMDALDSLAMMWDEQYAQTKNTAFLKQALQARKLAFIAEKKLLEAFSYDESMKEQLLSSKKRSGLALSNCYTLWQAEKKQEWLQNAILMNENSKAIVLLHSVNKNNTLSQKQADDSVAILLRKNRLNAIITERELNSATGEEKIVVQKKLDSLREVEEAQEIQLKIRIPELKRTGVDTTQLLIASLKNRLLNEHTCLLQYFHADTTTFVLWLDGNNNAGMAAISPNDLHTVNSFIHECAYPSGLYENDLAAFFRLAESCTHTTLPGPVCQSVQNGTYKKLLVIPDGLFSLLPFDALIPANEQFLVNFSTVYTGYSLSTLLANNGGQVQSDQIVVFTPFSTNSYHKKLPLTHTKDEAAAVKANQSHVTVYDDTAATVARFRNALTGNRVIHIATHAGANGDVPRIFFEDAIFNMQELYALPVTAELVVLNGCETGIGRVDLNEGPLSLARGFYYAGARNVINSLWQIDDKPSSDIFEAFYNGYSSGKAGEQLHQAKLHYLNNKKSRKEPYYWAGLVNIGLDEQPGTVKRKGNYWPLILTSALLLVLVPFAYSKFRKKR